MTPTEFEAVLDVVVSNLTNRMRDSAPCVNPKEFESVVLQELRDLCKSEAEDANPAFHDHAFPDIVVNGFGVEVKHTKKDNWLAVGNSIFEGMRDQSACEIYVVYGKMGGQPEVRWARYEDCVTQVRISHAPRFVVEMDRVSPFFDNIGIAYKDFAKLSPAEKMAHVRQYSRDRLKKSGEQLWWLEDLEEPEEPSHSLPIAVRLFHTLSREEGDKLRAEGALLCPEIMQGKHARGKYDRVGLYWLTRHGVMASQLRDNFTAGSVGARGGQRGHKYIIQSLHEIEQYIRHAANNLDDELFVEYWGQSCTPEKRISTWLAKADEHAPDWTPSAELFKDG